MAANPAVAALAPAKKLYRASIYPDADLPEAFGEAIMKLEALLEMPIWLIVQNEDSKWGEISGDVYRGFRKQKASIEEGKPVGILFQSPGGQADEAYRIMRLFQRRTENITAIIPHCAKSGATLMVLAGKRILMGRDAELGPIDVQIYDSDKEGYDSALNAVQSLERLNAYAIQALDQAMSLFIGRTRKKPEVLLPFAIDYANKLITPLSSKIDTIELTRRSRELKVAEEYALRLMRANYSRPTAERIASHLVSSYPTHGFVIGHFEAASYESPQRGKPFGLGLKVEQQVSKEVEAVFDDLVQYLERITAIGRIAVKEVTQ